MEIDINNLHHAYLLVGPKTEGEKHFSSVLSLLDFKETGNPDLFVYRTESFDIALARELKGKALEKPFGLRKIFLISANALTHQAQNALLKTLEEPSKNIHFFILLNTPDLLLPTLLSRMQVVMLKENENPVLLKPNSSEEFLRLSPKDRINFVKKFAESEQSLSVFLDTLLGTLRAKGSNTDVIEKVFTVRRFADDPSKMTRLILEHLALVLD